VPDPTTPPPDDAWPAADDPTVIQRQETLVGGPTPPPGAPPPEGLPPDRRIGAGMLLGLGALVLVAVLLRALLAVAIDEEGARVAGLPVPILNGVVSTLAALTIGISMRIVGILLIAALMVVPVIAAQRVAWSLRSTMGLSIAIGLGSVLTGLTVSYYANLPPGGTIVLTATGLFLLAAGVETVRGRL